jgi:hypothetical protein
MSDFFGQPYDPSDADEARLTRVLRDCVAFAATVEPPAFARLLQKLTRFELAALAVAAVLTLDEAGQVPDGDAEAFRAAVADRPHVSIDDLTFERHQQLRAGVVAVLDAHDDLDAAIETSYTSRANAVRNALNHLRQLIGEYPSIPAATENTEVGNDD